MHTSLEVSVGQKKELLIPPIWGCCGPTGGSIFTPGQKNHPAFFEGRWYTGKMARQKRPNGLCVLAAISEKAGFFNFTLIKNEASASRSTKESFIFLVVSTYLTHLYAKYSA